MSRTELYIGLARWAAIFAIVGIIVGIAVYLTEHDATDALAAVGMVFAAQALPFLFLCLAARELEKSLSE